MPHPMTAKPILDEQTLQNLRQLDPSGQHGLLVRVLSTFDAALRRQMAQMAEARDRGDAAGVAFVAHTVKSSAASVGALALSAQCLETERRLREGAAADLGAEVENLLTQAEGALQAVEAMLKPSSPR